MTRLEHLGFRYLSGLVAAALSVGAAGCATSSTPAESSDESAHAETGGSASASSTPDGTRSGTAIAAKIDEVVGDWNEGNDYRILYAQEGVYQPIEEDRVELEPAPFEMRVVTKPETAILVNVSRSPRNRDRVLRDAPLPEGVGHPATAMAEHPKNENRDIKLDDRGSNLLYHENAEKSRFDAVEERGDLVVGTRTVKHLFENRERTPVAESGGAELYVVEFRTGDGGMEARPPKRAYTIAFETD